MRTFVLLATLATLATLTACGGGDAPATDDMDQAASGEATATVADFAGTWDLTATLEGADAPVPVRIEGSADGAFTMLLEGRDPLPAAVRVVGDSLVMDVAQYESVLREGVMVSTRSAVAVEGDVMRGTILATYAAPQGPEVVRGTIEGSRAGM